MSKPTRAARRWLKLSTAVAASLGTLGSPIVRGSTYYWDTTTTGTWADPGMTNWSDNPTSGGNQVTPLSTDSVVFNQSTVNGNETVQVDTATGTAGITFANTGTTLIEAASGTPQTLSIDAGGILINSGAGAVTIGDSTFVTNLAMTAAQSWVNNSTSLFTVKNAVNNGGFTLSVSGPGATSIQGAISGAGALTLSNSASLTLAGTNTYTGGTTLASGTTLNFNSTSAIGTGALTIAGGSLDNTSGAALTNTNNNALQLNGDFTFLGGTGTTHDLNLGTGAVTLGASRIFTVNAGTLTLGGAISGSGFNISKTGAGTLSLGGVIGTGAGGISVTGGTLIVGNTANTFTGAVTVDGAGTILQVNGAASTATTGPLGQVNATTFKTVTLTNGATFRANANWNFNALGNGSQGLVLFFGSGGGAIDTPGGTTLTLDDGSATGTGATAEYLQNATGVASITITKTGTGTLVLNKQTLYTGALNVTGGLVQTTGANTFGVANNTVSVANGAAIDLNGQTHTLNYPLTLSGAGVIASPKGALTNSNPALAQWNAPITIASGGATIGNSAAGGLTLNAAATVALGANTLSIANTGTGNLTLLGVISGTGAVNVGAGGGLYVPSAANTYSGGTTLSSGSSTAIGIGSTGTAGSPTNGPFGGGSTPLILAGGSLRSGTAGPFTIANTVSATGDTTFISAGTGLDKDLTFSGPVTLAGTGARTFTLNSSPVAGGTGVFITGAISGPAGLTKAGLATLVLSGTNTYAGTATINGGTLEFQNTVSMPGYSTNATNINVGAGGTLGLAIGGTGQFAAADLVKIQNGTLPVTFAATGSFVGIDPAGSTGGLLTVSTVLTDTSSASLGYNKIGTGTLTLTGANSYTGTTLVTSGLLAAADGAGLPAASPLDINGSIGANTASFIPLTATFERSLGTGAGQIQLPGGNSGFTSQLAAQTVDIGSGGNPAALTWGGATFNPASLVLNDTGATNTINFLNPINLNGAVRTVAVNSTTAGTAATLSGALTGAGGGLTKTGGGTLNVTSPNNTFTGAVTVSAGTLSFNGAGTLPTASPITLGGGTLQILNDSSGTITGASVFNVGGTGTLNVGNNGGGTLGATFAFGAFSTPATATATTTTFSSNNANTITFTSLALPGSTGQTTTLIANTNVIFSGPVTNRGTGAATNFDTLALQGTSTGSAINGIIADASTGSITAGNYTPVTKTGTGTWALTAANTYTGVTTVGGGTLLLKDLTSASASSPFQVIGGSQVLLNNPLGTLQIAGNVAIGNGTATLTNTQGTVIAGGATGTNGNISLLDNSINSLTIRGNAFAGVTNFLTLGTTVAGQPSSLSFDIGTNSTDLINVLPSSISGSGKLNVQLGGGVINLNQLSGTPLQTGTYNLINFASGSTFTGGFTLGTYSSPAGELFTLSTPTASSTSLQLIVSGGAGSGNLFWTGSQSAVWNTNPGGTTNFVNAYTGGTNSPQPSSDSNVFFTASSAANLNTTLGQGFPINSLSFVGTASPAAPSATNSVTIGGSSPLTLNAAAGFTDQNGTAYAAGIGLVDQAGSAAHTISAPVILGASQAWEIDAGNALTASGAISGAFTLTKTGTGSLILGGANTFSGGLVIANGSVIANVSNATTVSGAAGPSTSAITLGSSTGGSASLLANAFTVSNPINLAAGAVGTLTIGNNGGTTAAVFSGAVALNGDNLTITTTGTTGSTTLSGGIAGTGNLVLNNPSTGGAIALTTTLVNNTGSITNNGSATGFTTISSVIGNQVSAITQNNTSLTSSLIIQGANTAYAGTTTVNSGRLDAQNTGTTNVIQALGTGSVVLNGGVLDLRANASGSFQTVTIGNNVTVAGTAQIDSQRITGANINTTFALNNLSIGGANNQLNVTGANNAALNVTGTTSITGPAVFNPTTAQFDLQGVVNNNGNAATFSGTGVTRLMNTSAATPDNLSGVLTVSGGTLNAYANAAGAAGAGSNSLGTAAVALSGTNPVLNLAPTFNGGLTTAATAGLAAKGYQNGTTLTSLATTNFLGANQAITNATGSFAFLNIPASGGTVTQLNSPTNTTAGFPANTSFQFVGLLNITNAGVYTFSTNTDDNGNLFIDGNSPIVTNNSTVANSFYLTAGLHTFGERVNNNGGNGAVIVQYQGPDQAALAAIPASAFSFTTAAATATNFGNNVTLAATTNATLNTASNTSLGSLTMTGTGAGTTLNVNGSGDITTVTFNGATTLTDSITINAATANVVLTGVLSGNPSITLTKTGFGSLSFNGNLNLAGINDAAGSIFISNTTQLNNTPVFGSNSIFDGGGSTQLASDFSNYSGILQNIKLTGGTSGAFLKQGPGVLTLASAVSPGSGTLVTVNQGLVSTSSNPATPSTLALNFNAAGAPTTFFDSGSTLTLGGPAASVVGGGQLSLLGINSGNSAQNFTSTLIDGGASYLVATVGTGTGASVALGLGNLTRNAGGTVDITLPAGTQSSTNGVTLSNPGTAGTLLTSANGTAFATVSGNDWAANSTASPGNIVAASAAGAAGASIYVPTTATTTAPGTTADVDSGASNTTAWNTQTINSLRFNAGAQTLTIAAANTLTITTGGVLFGSGTTGVTTITGGTIVPGAGQELVFINNKPNVANVIASVIADVATNATSVTYRGNPNAGTTGGIFDIRNNNTYTGPTYITNGRVGEQFTAAFTTPFGTGANAIVYVDGTQDAQFFVGSTAPSVTIANPFVIVGQGFNEGGTRRGVIRLDSSATSTPTLSGQITLMGDSTIGNNTAINTGYAVLSGNIVTSSAQGATSFALNKILTGDLRLTGTNAQTATNINAGLLEVPSDAALGVTGTGVSATYAPVTFTGASTLQFNNTSNIVLNAGRNIVLNAAAQFDNGPATSGTSVTIAGVISGTGALTKQDTNQQTLINNPLILTGANTFTGAVTIKSGSLVITNSSALGTGTKTITITPVSNPNSLPGLALDGSSGPITLPATMSFTTSYDALNTGVPIPNAGAIINLAGNNTIQGAFNLTSGGGGTAFNSLAGNLTISGAIAPSAASRIVYVRGAGTGNISGVIANGSTADLPVTKDTGTGTWTLSGANTYTGLTLVQNGTLALGNAAALGSLNTVFPLSDNSSTVSSPGALDLGGQAIANEFIRIAGTGVGGTGALTNSGGPASIGTTGATLSGIKASTTGNLATGFTITGPTSVVLSGGGAGSGAAATASFGVTTASFALGGGGAGYSAVPTLAINGGTSASATALMGVTAGSFTVNGGTGYTTAPSITFNTPTGGTPATGHFTLSSGVLSLVIDTPGSGYTAAATATIGTGGGGTGAAVTGTFTNLVVAGLTVTAPGSGFAAAPTVTITGGGTPTTAATFSGNNSNFVFNSFNITNIGSGYTAPLTATLTNATAAGLAVTANLSGVQLTADSSIGGTGDITINGLVTESGSHALTKVGANTLTLANANTYSGGTTISAGTLRANTPGATGSATGSGAVNVLSGGTLAGIGNITGTAAQVNLAAGSAAGNGTPGGTITAGSGSSAGSSTGLLTTSGGNATPASGTTFSQVWNGGGSATGTVSASGATYAWKVNAGTPTASTPVPVGGVGTTELQTTTTAAGTHWDTLSMTSLSINATPLSQFNILVVPTGTSASSFNPGAVYTWTIADVTSGNVSVGGGPVVNYSGPTGATNLQAQLQGLFALNTAALPSANPSFFSVGALPDGGAGDDIVISYNPAPEPTSLLMLGLGAGGLMLRRRRTRRAWDMASV